MELQGFGLLLSPFLSLQDNHEEDYFLYVAYSDESVYGKWAPAPQACRRDGLMEWIWGGVLERRKEDAWEEGKRTGSEPHAQCHHLPCINYNHYFLNWGEGG